MMAFTPSQAAAVALQDGCARIFARWAPQLKAAGDDVEALRRVFRGMVIEVGVHLAELLALAGAGSHQASEIPDVMDRIATILAQVVVEAGEAISRAAGTPFASAAWLDEVGYQDIAAFRGRLPKLLQAPGGRA